MPWEMLQRNSAPTKYDHLAYGTVCKCKTSTIDEYEIYVQSSKSKDSPHWHLVGTFSDLNESLIRAEVKKCLKLKNP